MGIKQKNVVKFGRVIFSARCNIYISRLCYDVSVRLSVRPSVTEVHWRIVSNLGFKFRSKFTAHCGRGEGNLNNNISRKSFVCVFVCLSVRMTWKLNGRTSPHFFCLLHTVLFWRRCLFLQANKIDYQVKYYLLLSGQYITPPLGERH